MKLLRAIAVFLAGLILSHFLVASFFNDSDYYTIPVNRLFLTAVPALAIGAFLFVLLPSISQWITDVVAAYSLPRFVLAFFLSFGLAYGVVGFLHEAMQPSMGMVVFIVVFMAVSSLCADYLLGRVARSLSSGFLSKFLNILLVLALPLFFVAVISVSLQFPSVLAWSDITIPWQWMPLLVLSASAGGVVSLLLLEKLETSGYLERFKEKRFFVFLSGNLPGLYAGGMFFLINLILARAFHHPALSYNSVLFEADAGSWMNLLAGPDVDEGLRSVHPLSLIIIRPVVRAVAVFMGEQWDLAGMLVVAAMSAACVFMAWLYIMHSTAASTYAFCFAILLGATATHLVFGSLTENYIFGAAALILFFLLLQAGEDRLSILLPAGLLLFGITISNLAQGMIGLFFRKYGLRRLIRYGILALGAGVILTFFTGLLYPSAQRFFFVPGDIAFEANFVERNPESFKGHLFEKFQVVSRTMFLYAAVGPSPVEVVSNKPPYPTIDIRTFDQRTHRMASYRGFANVPLGLWLLLLAGSFLNFVKKFRSGENLPLKLGLLGSLGFNFLFHLAYGTELFLYTPYWTFALVLFIALALGEFAGNKWMVASLAVVIVTIMANNLIFIFSILRGLAPFYAAV